MGRDNLNLKEYVERLGLKRTGEPTLIPSVQPIVIVGDLRHLINPLVRLAAIVGGLAPGGAGVFASFQVVSPSPVVASLSIGAATAAVFAFTITPAATAPVLAAPTVLTPQPFADVALLNDRFASSWSMGTVAAALGAGLPRVRVAALTQTTLGDGFARVFVPAGFALTIVSDNAGVAVAPTLYATFYEMADEPSQ